MAEAAAPLATICIPTFNRATVLPRAVASALAQDYGPIEILIVDNAATDETGRICQGLLREDPRIRYIRQPTNVGVVRNFETGLENANGHYFMWLADDDWITPNYVSCCVAELELKNHSIVHGKEFWRTEDSLQPEPTVIRCLDPSPARRIFTYLGAASSNSVTYGLARTADLRSALPFPQAFGLELLWISRLLAKGTFDVVDDAQLHRNRGGMSSDEAACAAHYGTYWLPRTSLCLGMVRGLILDQVSGRIADPSMSRMRFTFRATVLTWVRYGGTGELFGPARIWLQRVVPSSIYRVLKRCYGPIRSVTEAARSRIVGDYWR